MRSLIETAPGVAAIALGVAALVFLGRLHWTVRRHDTPVGAFDRVARCLGMRRFDRRVVRRIAAAAGIDHPAALLVSEGAFDRATEAYSRRGGDARAAIAVRDRLFARAEPHRDRCGGRT